MAEMSLLLLIIRSSKVIVELFLLKIICHACLASDVILLSLARFDLDTTDGASSVGHNNLYGFLAWAPSSVVASCVRVFVSPSGTKETSGKIWNYLKIKTSMVKTNVNVASPFAGLALLLLIIILIIILLVLPITILLIL